MAKISVQEYSALILEKVQEVMTEERFKAFLLSPDLLQAFRTEVLGQEPYSFNNRLTLALFGASAVAGYMTWQSLGFFVKKGSRGIPIYRPLVIKNKEDESDEDLNETNEPERKLIGFDVAFVFDFSQVGKLDGDENRIRRERVDSFFTRRENIRLCKELIGGDDYLFSKLLEWAKLSYPVSIEPIPGGAKGNTDGKRITLKEGMHPAQTTKTLLHELAHCRLGHIDSKSTRNAMEIQAETAAFVAAHNMGLETGSYSFDYLAAWGKEILDSENGAVEFRSILQQAIEEGQSMAMQFKRHQDMMLPVPISPFTTPTHCKACC